MIARQSWNSLERRDFVYVHDPIHKRGKAREFSYQYKGPYETEEKISPIIYKVRQEGGTSVILYLNRLRRAFEQAVNDDISPLYGSSNKVMKLRRTRKLAPRENKVDESKKLKAENPPRPQVIQVESETSDGSDVGNVSPSQIRRADPEWTRGPSYLRKELRSNDTADNVAYRLRSRLVSRSERDAEVDKEQVGIQNSQGSEHMLVNTQRKTSPGRIKPATTHPYNLKGRIDSTNTETQEK